MGTKVYPKTPYDINTLETMETVVKKRTFPQLTTAPNKAVSILIPKNIDIRKLLIKYPPALNSCVNSIHQQEDKVATIVSLLVKAINKNIQMGHSNIDDFVPLSSKILQPHVRDYNDYLSYLKEVGIIETDGQYIVNEKCCGYRFTREYRYVPLTEFFIPNYRGNVRKGAAVYESFFKPSLDQVNTIEKYDDLYDDLRSVTVTDYEYAKSYITKDMKQLAEESVIKGFKKKRNGMMTKYKNATAKVKNKLIMPNATAKQNSWIVSLHDIENKHFYFKQDTTSNRVHTSVLGVKSECRQFLRLKNKEIISCDLKNSQPYISSILFTEGTLTPEIRTIIHQCLKNLKSVNNNLYKSIVERIALYKSGGVLPSTKNYIHLVQHGELYEFLAINYNLIMNERGGKHIQLMRADGKNKVFTLFFNPAKFDCLARDIFRSHFPEVMTLFEDINSLFTHTRRESIRTGIPRSRNNLAILLQTIESHLILDVICKELKDTYPHIPLLTIHDAIATNPEYTELVEGNMKYHLAECIGVPPKIALEDWF